MAHGVFDQRLQQQGRQARAVGRRVQAPLQLQAFAKAHLLNRQVAPGQCNLIGQGDRFTRVDQRVAKQVAEVLQQGLGLGRLGPHQGDGAVEGVKQKVWPDARLQLGKPCRRLGRRPALGTQDQARHQHRRQQDARKGAGQPGWVLQQAGHGQQGAAVQRRARTQQQCQQVLQWRRPTRQQALGHTSQQQPAQCRWQGTAGDQR